MGFAISKGFKKYGDDKLSTFSSTIHLKMSDDAAYGTLKTASETVKVKNDAFIVGIANAKLRGEDRVKDKNDRRDHLITALVKLARQLEDLAEDNERLITDTGFEVNSSSRKAREVIVITELQTPVVEVKNLGKSGSALVTCPLVPNAINYAFRHRMKTETVWQNGNYNDKGTFTITNLEEGVYEFQVVALGPDSVASEPSQPVPAYIT
jgi:hypothetical protein